MYWYNWRIPKPRYEMTIRISDEKQRKRQQRAWYMYDFGNSAYAAVILLAVYSAYFQNSVVGGTEGTRLWGLALGIAMLSVAVLTPFLGAIADFSASKKRFLLLFSSISWIATALLFFVQKGNVWMGFAFFVIAEVGYRGGQVFYNALLPDIATPDEMGKVSGNGWAIGSLGGIVCLLFILPVIILTKSNPDLNLLVVRSSFAFTAVFFAISSISLFRRVQEAHQGKSLPTGETYLSIALKRLANTFKAVRHFREFIKFIISFLIYNDGVLMALNFASIIGVVLFSMNQTQLIIFMIIVQFTSALGAYLFGILSERMSFKRALLIALVLMMGTVTWMVFNQTLPGYFIIGALAGFALTGVQSLSRTMAGLFAPEQKSAEFFSFFAIAGKSSSFIGPVIFGTLAYRASVIFEGRGIDAVEAGQLGYRIALGLVVVFLAIGLTVLLSVNEKRARQAAQEYAPAAD
jgi:MFS transporter, UMF1 family